MDPRSQAVQGPTLANPWERVPSSWERADGAGVLLPFQPEERTTWGGVPQGTQGLAASSHAVSLSTRV